MKNNTSDKPHKILLLCFLGIASLPLLALSPWFFPPEWGKALAFRIIFSVILLLFAWQMLSRKNFHENIIVKCKANIKIFWIIISLALIAVISTIFSSDILFSLWSSPHRSGGAVNFIFTILFSLVIFLTAEKDDWKKMWDFSFAIADVVVLFAAIQYFGFFENIFISYEGRPPSTLSNPILLAIYLALLIFPAAFFAIKEKSKKAVFYRISLILFFFGIFISGSRAAYLGVAAGMFYFFIFYPKKMRKIKLAVSGLAILAIVFVFYISFAAKLPGFIENNPRLSLIARRISIVSMTQALTETRYSAWQTFYKSIKEKPVFGWGAENQSIAFDKHYDPELNYLIRSSQNWWDRAHNVFLDIAVSYGTIFLAIYVFFFIYLFLRLQKTKIDQPEKKTASHAIQAALLAYGVSLLSGFDSVTTHLALFFLVGYAFFLIARNDNPSGEKYQISAYHSFFKKRKVIMPAAVFIFIWFLWSYALIPLYVNGKINLADKSECDKKIPMMEDLLSSKSFLKSYIALNYVEHIKGCGTYISNNEKTYIKKTIGALKESAMARPKYTRTWLLLSQFTNALLAMEVDSKAKETLKKDSRNYINQAKQLSPKRQEIYSAEVEIYFAEMDSENMKKISEECISVNKNASSCWWYSGISEILLKNEDLGEKNIETARQKGYDYNNKTSLSQLALAYTQNKNYKRLISIYSQLLELESQNIDFRARLAFIHRETGDYENAKKEALKIIKSHPEAEEEVNEFLKTLP